CQEKGRSMTKTNGIDQKLIRDLAGILNDTNLTEIEVEYGDLKLRVARQAPAVHAVAAPPPQAPASAPAAPAQAPAAPAAADPGKNAVPSPMVRSEEHTSELQSRENLVCRLLLEK